MTDEELMLEEVALRKESVDRNLISGVNRAIDIMSLSARRAWIEMTLTALWSFAALVALRKESVDRNISPHSISCMILTVALRKESVDRNSS